VLALAVSVVLVVQAWWLAAIALGRAGSTTLDPSERFAAVVVLGCRVLPSGAPGPAFVRRLDVGAALLRDGVAPKLVVTGGRVSAPVSEADAGLAYLEGGALAPRDRIVREDQARNTRENATRVHALIGDVPVLVVTTDWHVPRARRVFARSFTHVRCVGAPGRLRGALREVVPFLLDRLRRT
jgi:uncharacterized SAM-binding protein YcdF (DUF218 family)